MPQIGNQKFPYTPAGKKRYQQIKSRLQQSVSRKDKATGIGRANAIRPIKKYPGRKFLPGMGNQSIKATRPGGSVRPVVQGGKGATLPSLKERRNKRFM